MTRQQTRFLSLLSGWDQAQKYTEVAAESAGTALEKFSIHEESIKAKTNRMTNAFEHFSATLLDSGLVGGVLDLGTGLLTAMAAFDAWPAKIAITTTSILTLSTAISMFQKSSFASAFTKIVGGLGWPIMTGDKWIIVPSYGEETA